MATDAEGRHLARLSAGLPLAPTLAAMLIRRLGGRYSTEMGIDLDAGDSEVERWFVASTLFGARIAATVAERTFAVLEESGIHRITDVAERQWSQLVALLDAGGYARYDLRTAARLHVLARQVTERYGGQVTEIGRRFREPDDLWAALDDLTGWGPVTVALFLRELRGLWPAARPALDRRAAQAARHLGLLRREGDPLGQLELIGRLSGCDPRDVEAALVRVALGHAKARSCPGGRACVMLAWPPGVPSGPVRTVPLPRGRMITIRPMQSDDGPGLVALYADLSEEDLYRRFFAARPPPEALVMDMAAIAQRGGGGLVATIDDVTGDAAPSDEGRPRARIVAEATYAPLANGNAEVGITVARRARGWLGPYLLDALLEDAASHGVPNLQADVLMVNGQMLAMLRSRGYAVIGFDDQPAIVRAAVGTVGKAPSWPGAHDARRVLVEVPGGRWHGDDAIRHAGFEVMSCPSPPGGWAACPARRGEPCPLAAGADVIIDAVPGEAGRSLLEAHRRTHPCVPLCAELRQEDLDPGPLAERIPPGAPAAVVEAILDRVVPPAQASHSPQAMS